MSQKSQQTEKEIKVKPATKIIIILTNILSIIIPLVAFTIIPLVVDNFHLFYYEKDRFILYNSKKAEVSSKQYIFTNTSGNDGSLVGRRIAVGDAADPFIEIVIFFSTTGDILFVPDNNERQIKELKNKLKGWFFNAFDKRIKIELALFFLNNYSF